MLMINKSNLWSFNDKTLIKRQITTNSDPVQARRIQQRARMIMFGKNTAGYDEYVKQVPKESRRPRCMDHPATPDHTLDIPNRRWQGMVKAW